MTITSGLCIVNGKVTDGVAAPVLAGILEATLALYDELGASGVAAPCAAMIVSGAMAALDRGLDSDDGCCGQLWVRLVTLFPSINFPTPDVVPSRDFLSWAAVVEVGVARPAPTLTGEGPDVQLPTTGQEEAAADQQALDAAVVREAVLNRYADPDGADIPVVLGAFTPFGPDGGVVGGATTVTVQIV